MRRTIWARLRALWRWNRRASDLEDEIAFHLSEEADEQVAAGLSDDDARAAAKRDFGNAALVREVTREVWGWGSSERLIHDVRYGLRAMRRHWGISAGAVLTLGLGIGAATATFSVAEAVLIRSLPFPAADRVVALFATNTNGNAHDTTSFPDFSDWQRQSHAFTAVAAYRKDRFNLTGDGPPEPIPGLRASHELFRVLGVGPAIGRGFDPPEQHQSQAVAVISDGLWTHRYGRDPEILHRTILLNDVSYAVIGVLPPAFEFPAFYRADVLVPIPERASRSNGYLLGVARLKPHADVGAAQQELDAIAQQLAVTFPWSNRGRGVRLVGLHEDAAGNVRAPLLMLFGAALSLLLIGCANTGHLVLTQGVARQRELAVRIALGAGRGRLIRQLLTESTALALVAGACGAVLSVWGRQLLVASLTQRFALPQVTLNWITLAFAVGLAVACGLLCGLPAALLAWKSGLNGCLKQDGRNQSGGRTQRRLGSALLVSQTALTVMLLVGAGLLAKSFVRLQQIDLGLDPRHALTADLLLSKRYVDPDRRETFVRALLDSVAGLPGVENVAIHTDPPFLGGGSHESFKVEGLPDPRPGHGYAASFDVVSGRFFHAMGIPFVRGRDFDQQDTVTGVPVAIINETMARQAWPAGEARGKRLQLYYDKDPQRWMSIVGVVRDVRYLGRLIEPVPQVFVPSQQRPYGALPYPEPFLSLVVRTAPTPASMISAVRASIWAVDKDQPIATLQPMDQVLWESAAAPRIYMLLFGIFGGIALAIASAGIYGLSAYAVARRRPEIGIRLALGATSGQILALVVRHAVLLVVIGLGVGLAGALAVARVISGFLYGTAPTDAATFLAVVVFFATAACVATYLPARRATLIDPTVALRSE
jgi:predicted permease